MSSGDANTSAPEHAAASASQAPASVDVDKLADKVYRLMLAEIRLERARQGGTAGRR
jgi:hypothetical protein